VSDEGSFLREVARGGSIAKIAPNNARAVRSDRQYQPTPPTLQRNILKRWGETNLANRNGVTKMA
jgi:hypothetical protein